MREMKDSGVEWIGQIPKDWKIKKPKYIGSIRSGDSVTNKKLNDDIGYEVFGGNGTIGFYDKYNVDGTHIIIGRVGALCGNSRITRGKKFISDNALIYTCFEGQAENYINYIFDAFNLNKLNTSNAQPLITGSKVLNIFIPYPNIIEQKIIADFLDSKCSEIDATAEDIQKEISLLEDYKKSVITEAVTKGLNPDAEMKDSGIEWIGQIPKHWKVVRLEFLSWVRARLGWKGLKADEYVDEGYPFLSAFNIQDSKIKWEPLNFITKERFDESPEIMVACGDVLLLKDGAGVGKCARIDSLPKGDSTVNSSLAVITCFDNLNYRYLYYSFNSSFFSNLINLKLNGMGVPHLTQEELRKFIVLLPCVKEQQQIADFLDTKCSEIDAIIADKKRQRNILAEYKKSLIYEYVTGKKEVPVHE